MSEELGFDLMSWWNEQTFPNKQLYKVEETGDLVLCANNNIKERIIAKIAQENAGTIISTLQEKFAAVESKVREMEIEWIATEDKQKMADKVANLKDYLQQVIRLQLKPDKGKLFKYFLSVQSGIKLPTTTS